MKKLILIAAVFFVAQVCLAQNNDYYNNHELFTIVENMPSWKGCEGLEELKEKPNCTHNRISDYLTSEIIYPEVAKQNKKQGTVYITFIISPEGKVLEPKILRGIAPELDEEAIRVISNMPAWNPGIQRGKTVAVQYNLPIKFSLNNSSKK